MNKLVLMEKVMKDSSNKSKSDRKCIPKSSGNGASHKHNLL